MIRVHDMNGNSEHFDGTYRCCIISDVATDNVGSERSRENSSTHRTGVVIKQAIHKIYLSSFILAPDGSSSSIEPLIAAVQTTSKITECESKNSKQSAHKALTC